MLAGASDAEPDAHQYRQVSLQLGTVIGACQQRASTIAVPAPFDVATLLERIRAHVVTWPGKQLLDPAFAAQLDRYLVAAANAYRLNNPKAGKEHIETIRKTLAKEHRHVDHDDEDGQNHKAATCLTIDRLAARVLDFDLRYVLKRMEHEHEKGDHRKGRESR